MSEADSLPSPATPLAKPRGGRVLDTYGFEVREEFVELHEEHESIWREEEDERVQRWDVFLQELNDRYGSGEGSRQDAALLERAVDCYRKAYGQAQGDPADPVAQDDGEASVLAQRLGMLVQAGVPRHLRAKVWPLLLGAHRYDPGEYDALVALATRHEAEELADDSLRSFYPPESSEAGFGACVEPVPGGEAFDPELSPSDALEERVDPGSGGAITRSTPAPAAQPDAIAKGVPSTTVAQDAFTDPAATPRSVSPEHVEWLAQVDKDLRRTFPGHRAMQREGRASLRRVLAAYAARNPAVGYCQGLNFVAGTFLLFLPEERAFWCVCAVVERVLPGYFSAELEAPALDARILGQLLRGFFPATAAHLRALEVDIGSLTLHWFLCLFVTSLPTETCLRVWDLIFLEGHPVALFRVALALVDVFNGALVETRESSDAYMLLQALAPMSFDASRLVDTACIAFRGLQPAAVEVLRDKFRREVAEQNADLGHQISWRTDEDEDTLHNGEGQAHADTSTDRNAVARLRTSSLTERTMSGLRTLKQKLAAARASRRSKAESETGEAAQEDGSEAHMASDAPAQSERSSSERGERVFDGAPGAAAEGEAMAAALATLAAPLQRRAASTGAGPRLLSGLQLGAFLRDRRKPSVVAALEAARPSPIRSPSFARTPIEDVLAGVKLDGPCPSRLHASRTASRTAPSLDEAALGAGEPGAERVSRALFFSEDPSPQEVLDASRRVLRRHTVSGAEHHRASDEGKGAAQAPASGPRSVSQPIHLALEMQLDKVSALQRSKALVLGELRRKCDAVTARLTELEQELWDGQEAVATAAKALQGKRATAEHVSKRLALLLRWAETLAEPHDVASP